MRTSWISLLCGLPAVGGPIEDLQAEMPRGAEEDAIIAIDDPPFGSGEWLDPEDPVVGVEISGTARAYPVRVLDYHEIVNDEVDGRPIAATFCPLCGSGVVYDRRVGDRTLTMAVSGRLYRNDLVMFDRETGSLWPQILGEALHGDLEGEQFHRIPSVHTTWDAWRREHPDTLALEPPDIYPRATYESRSHPGYEDEPDALFERTVQDERLHPKRWVVGLELDGEAVAVPLDVVGERGCVRVEIADQVVEVVDRDGPVDALSVSSGEPVPTLVCYWLAWVEFNPETALVYAE